MKKLACSLLLLVALLPAFAQFRIEARLTGFADGTVFYLKDIEADQVLDSATLRKGRLVITGQFEYGPRGLWLYHSGKGAYYYCNLFMGNEKMLVQGDRKDFPYYVKRSGSPTQDIENILNRQTASYNFSRDSLTGIAVPLMYKEENKPRQDSLWKLIRVIDDSVENVTQRFIDQHINSYAGLRWLNYKKSKMDTARIQQLLSRLRPALRDHRYTQIVKTFLRVGKPLVKGDQSRNFEAVDSTGRTYHLADYRGKYVLLNFSITYCGPCILSKGELIKTDSLYRDQLQVLTFNADASRATWLLGVQRDHPTWPVLWDSKGPASETVMKYGVTGYPTFVLVDPQGKVVRTWSGYGKGDILSNVQKELVAQNKP